MEINLTFPENVETEWERLKHKETRYIIIKCNDDQSSVELEKVGERDETFDQFVENMPKDEPRWAIFELHVDKDDGSTADKMVFFHYSPDTYFGSLKFFFAHAKDHVVHHFVGVNKSIQVNDHDEFDVNEAIKLFL